MEELNKLDKKDLARRWAVSVRSVERIVKQYGAIPEEFKGRQPVWTIGCIKRMEKRRDAARRAMLGYPTAIITVNQAKSIARKRGAK